MPITAWYMCDAAAGVDQRSPQQQSPPVPVSRAALAQLGVLSWEGLGAGGDPSTDAALARIRAERGYSYTDTIAISPEKLPNYEEKIKMFYLEHLHTDEEARLGGGAPHQRPRRGGCRRQATAELFAAPPPSHLRVQIRLVLEGSGYFDVKDKEDRWVRVAMEAGDMIVLPAGIYHRFTLDERNYIKAMRLFVGEPVWTAYNRGEDADAKPARAAFLAALASGAIAASA